MHAAPRWALATIQSAGRPVAVIDHADALYALAPTLARAGLPGMATLMDIFPAWDKVAAALDTAAFDPADHVVAERHLAPLLYPGKILCAGANYYDHLAEMGMPDAKKQDQRLFFLMKPPRNAVVGTPADIADLMESWFAARACDGFNIMPPFMPEPAVEGFEWLVPELQRRGLVRTGPRGDGALRGTLGLERPVRGAYRGRAAS